MDNERHRHRSRDGKDRKRSRSRSVDSGDDDRRRRKDHSSKRHKKDKHRYHDRRRHDEDSASSSMSSSSSKSSRDDRRKHHSKKRHRKEKKKKHKKHKHKKKKDRKHSRRSRSRSPSNSPRPASESIPPAPPGAHELAAALTQLFNAYPAMTSLDEGGIPLLFIQLSRGTEYNLSQMPDRNLAHLLGIVFDALKVHGMELGDDGAWKWGNATKGSGANGGGGNDLALLRLTRALLNGVGVSMDSVEQYERGEMQKLQKRREDEMKLEREHMKDESGVEQSTSKNNATSAKESEEDIRHRKRVERMTSQMLDRFDPKGSSTSESSLANELQGICGVLVEGESIQLDGIENGKLRATLDQLFQLIGLDLVEMEEEEDEDEEGGAAEKDGDEEKAMGYALPDRSGLRDTVASRLDEVLRVCRFRSSGGSQDAPKSWATSTTIPMQKGAQEESSSDDDDDGPAPLGTVAAAKASKRKRPPQMQNKAMAGKIEEGGREEWMMVPGEHDFLKGISKSTRSRTFKNEKQRGQSIAPAGQNAKPINPQVLEEVSAIQRAYEQSRGPSLLDAHRQKVQETKEQEKLQGTNKEWKWSRDKNLDEGRRVDKNALHTVLGGASTELKSKFQGSLGGR